jgi:hypothetical protein
LLIKKSFLRRQPASPVAAVANGGKVGTGGGDWMDAKFSLYLLSFFFRSDDLNLSFKARNWLFALTRRW